MFGMKIAATCLVLAVVLVLGFNMTREHWPNLAAALGGWALIFTVGIPIGLIVAIWG